MQFIKENIINPPRVKALAQLAGLVSIVALLPFYLHIQWITGPIINAIFIIILFLSGIRTALLVCLVPSLMALSGGLLPVVLAPIVPFIMMSNFIFVLTIEYLYNNFKKEKIGYWVAITAGSVLKFVFLYLSVNFVAKLVVKQELVAKMAQIMTWPQLSTALLGGIIAWFVLKWLKRI